MNETGKKLAILAAVVIILVSIGLRLNAPYADLPSHITFSGSILTDEGNQCHNSRSKALFDDWYPDDWRITNYNPILPYIKLASFKLFGVGIFQMRLFSHLFAALSLLFFYLMLRSLFKEHHHFALLGTFLLGINFLYVMYNKIGTFETGITFWVILTLYFLEWYRAKPGYKALIFAGAAAFMGFIFKSIMVYLLPLPFVAVLLMHLFSDTSKFNIKKTATHFFWVCLGMFLLFLPWYLFHYLPNKEWIVGAAGEYMGNLMFPRGLQSAFNNFLSFNWKDQFYKIPVVWVSSLLFLPVFYRRLLRKKADLTQIGTVLFFFAHTFLFFVMSYRPTRYFVPVIPVMVIMTVMLWHNWFTASSRENGTPQALGRIQTIAVFGLDTLWLTAAAYFCFLPLLGRIIPGSPMPTLSFFFLIVSALLVAASYFLKGFFNKNNNLPVLSLTKPLIAVLIAVSLFVNFSYYLKWHNNKTYNIHDMSVELGRKLVNAYIGGMTSTVAVLENKHKALWLYPNFVNWEGNIFEKYPMTHALLGTDVSREVHHFFQRWPKRMKHAELQKIYPIKNYSLHLYSFQNPYIEKEIRHDEDGASRLTLQNPSDSPIKASVGRVVITPQEPGYIIQKGNQKYSLQPGGNPVVIPVQDHGSLPHLFFLDYPSPFKADKNALRYEGENFPSKTGMDKRDAKASNGKVRYFNPALHQPGFLSYGPAVPYAPGFIVVRFRLSFGTIKSKLRPLCHLDIYSHQDKAPIAQRSIKASDIKKGKTVTLTALLPSEKTLEFRVQTTQYAEISFDAVDITYYQGVLNQLN